jgi:eukaryotic-like serine/threonine-protein kinase
MKLDESLVGTRLAENLLIEEYLGRGGMGVTYKAFQNSLSRSVCVKFLSATSVADATAFERFKREALILAKLTHPGIVQFYFFGLAENIYPFFAMEYVDGKNLRQMLSRDLSWRSACRIIAQICTALGHAHQQGYIHRDIKPDNIMIVNSDVSQVKLLDFGLAGIVGQHRNDLTQTGMIWGVCHIRRRRFSPDKLKPTR